MIDDLGTRHNVGSRTGLSAPSGSSIPGGYGDYQMHVTVRTPAYQEPKNHAIHPA